MSLAKPTKSWHPSDGVGKGVGVVLGVVVAVVHATIAPTTIIITAKTPFIIDLQPFGNIPLGPRDDPVRVEAGVRLKLAKSAVTKTLVVRV